MPKELAKQYAPQGTEDRICLKVTAPAALCRACINPRLAAKVRFGHTLSHCICIL